MTAAPLLQVLRSEGASRLHHLLRGEESLSADELASADDPGLYGPQSVVWKVHADAAMLIGGLRALLLQTLHPLAMAGVSDHSDYRTDPWGRLRRTGRFIGATTYGSTATAEREIALVRRVHDRVEGVAPDGRAYRANDPHLLLWVHVTEVDSFLRAFEQYAADTITAEEADVYVAEMAIVAEALGSAPAPRNRSELEECLTRFRDECTVTDAAREATQFLLWPPVPLYFAPSYRIIAGAAVALLPTWARQQLRLPIPPGARTLAIQPVATALTRVLEWMLDSDEAASAGARAQLRTADA